MTRQEWLAAYERAWRKADRALSKYGTTGKREDFEAWQAASNAARALSAPPLTKAQEKCQAAELQAAADENYEWEQMERRAEGWN